MRIQIRRLSSGGVGSVPDAAASGTACGFQQAAAASASGQRHSRQPRGVERRSDVSVLRARFCDGRPPLPGHTLPCQQAEPIGNPDISNRSPGRPPPQSHSPMPTSRRRWLSRVVKYGLALYQVPEALRADKEVVLAAVTQEGFSLWYASQALRADKEVVLAAVAQNANALNHAAEALRADKEVVLAAVAQHGFALERAAEALRADKEFVLAVVAQHGFALQYATEALRADKEVVLAAVAQHGVALHYAVPALAHHVALRKIGQLSGHWALELAKKRLCLAVLASASAKVCTIAALSADIIELVGTHITRDTAVRSLVARHHYWPTCEPPPIKKHRA
jgi:hypothetical protein